ncbi:MAG: glycoside hydrolase family 92 protein [Deltaproteobacteria bacterium]|nr:glycoside hydrolase family 92 protein [Deltaproteobacteria bacterium]
MQQKKSRLIKSVFTGIHALFALVLFFTGCSVNRGNGDNGKKEEPFPDDCVEMTNVFQGTGGEGFSTGQVTPSACRPFGPMRVGPNTSGKNGAFQAYHFSGYYYPDEYSFGIAHVRMSGIGGSDQGNILFQPLFDMDESDTREAGYKRKMDKKSEQASPGYYKVKYEQGITIELTATRHCALHNYTYENEAGEPCLLIDAGAAVPGSHVTDCETTLDPKGKTIYGWALNKGGLSGRYGGLKVFFRLKLDGADISRYGAFEPGSLHPDETHSRGSGGIYVCFKKQGAGTTSVTARVGISYVDQEGADNNLKAETSGLTFEQVKADAAAEWKKMLCRIKVIGGTKDQRRIFYSSLYHSFIMPTVFEDSDSRYMGFDNKIHKAYGFTYYTDFSLWDTFRTLHPLLALLLPERQNNMLQSLVTMYEQGGAMPRWPQGTGYTGSMIGSHADAVFADSIVKGLTGFDVQTAYKGIRASATGVVDPVGRGGIEDYLSLGWVPADKEGSSVSRTMEFSFDDFCVAQVAEYLGAKEDMDIFLQHSGNYKNLFDPDKGFFRGRNSDGTWFDQGTGQEWDPLYFSDEFAEGNAWQYFWFVPHDVAGLAELAGGKAKLLAKLEQFFELTKQDFESGRSDYNLLPKPYYWHGNEPDIQAAYMFCDLGRPDLAQKWSRWIMENRYNPNPDGIPGNDDCGTMGSWYVWSAIGLYPVVGKPYYYLIAPLFHKVSIELGDKTLTIVKESIDGDGDGDEYIQSATLDGRDLQGPFIKHSDVLSGTVLKVKVGSEPSSWGTGN